MAVSTVAVGTLLNRLSWIIDGQNTADTTYRPNYLWALQQAFRELVHDTDFWTFRTQATLTLVNGTEDYVLADDFRSFIDPSMVYTGSYQGTIWSLPHQSYDDMELARSTAKSKPRRFMLIGRQKATVGALTRGNAIVRFHPTPDVAYTLRYRYFAYPDAIDGDTDGLTVMDPRFPVDYLQAVVSGAVLHFPDRLVPQEMQGHARNFEMAKRQLRLDNRAVIGNRYPRENYSRRSRGRIQLWDATGTVGSAWNSGLSGPDYA